MSVKYCSQIVAQVHILHSIIHSIMFLILIHSIGAHRIQGDGVVYRVNKIIMHAGFSMSHLRNDIALMRLVKPVQLGPKVGTVCFPRKNTRVATGTKCWISGLSSLIKETGCLFLVIDSNSISVIVLARNANLVGRGGRGFYHFPPVHDLLWEWGRGSRRKRLLVELLAIHGFNHELPTKKIASSLSRSFDISF